MPLLWCRADGASLDGLGDLGNLGNLSSLGGRGDGGEVRSGSGDQGRVGGSSRHAQDGYLLKKVWVRDFGRRLAESQRRLSLYPKGRALVVGCFRLREIDGGFGEEMSMAGEDKAVFRPRHVTSPRYLSFVGFHPTWQEAAGIHSGLCSAIM